MIWNIFKSLKTVKLERFNYNIMSLEDDYNSRLELIQEFLISKAMTKFNNLHRRADIEIN